MFLTPRERESRGRGPEPGVRVRFVDRGVTHFYPGADANAALALAKTWLPGGALDGDEVAVEFGDRSIGPGGTYVFAVAEVVKVARSEFTPPEKPPAPKHWTEEG